MKRFVLGLDLGQAHDYTALVIIERTDAELHVRHIERLALGTPYPRQVERIAALATSPQMAQNVTVAADATGVGRAVIDLLREAVKQCRTPVVAVTITGGVSPSRDGPKWSVPKRDLIGAAQVALQTGKLKIAASLPDAQTLADELSAYRVTVSEDGRDSYGNGRETPNDDLVLALAIGTYVANRRHRGGRITHVGREPPLGPAEPFVPDVVIPPYIFQ